VGHSAGGHLALWAAARHRLPADAPGAGPRIRPRAVVSQAGIADLRLALVSPPSDEPTRALLPSDSQIPLASPRELVPLGARQLVLHGELDDIVSVEISRSYAAAAQAAGDECELRILPATGHFEHIDPGSEAWRLARDWLAATSQPG
jgi:acetyl esterase/lipase